MFAMIPSYMSDLHQDFCHVTHGRGRSSVLLWRRSDMLCTSGFIDDVIFAHKPGSLDLAAQLKLGWAISCAQYYHNGRKDYFSGT